MIKWVTLWKKLALVSLSKFRYAGHSPPPNVMKYAAPYHETLFKSWNSSVMLGMAVPRIVWELTSMISILRKL
jgi:hypothetical protein